MRPQPMKPVAGEREARRSRKRMSLRRQRWRAAAIKLQEYGALLCAASCASGKRKRLFAELGALEALVTLIQSTSTTRVAERSLHALINLTVDSHNQQRIARLALYDLFEFARCSRYRRCQRFACKVLENIRLHQSNRTLIYKAELHYRLQDWKRSPGTIAGTCLAYTFSSLELLQVVKLLQQRSKRSLRYNTMQRKLHSKLPLPQALPYALTSGESWSLRRGSSELALPTASFSALTPT